MKETLASKHMDISMGNQEVTCIDTDWYGCGLKPMEMADLLAASRICFWGSNRVMNFVVFSKMKTLSLQDYGNHYFQIFLLFFFVIFISFMWAFCGEGHLCEWTREWKRMTTRSEFLTEMWRVSNKIVFPIKTISWIYRML